jgi:Ser/Thr protein kinase RdoA (MazF antagonist)
MHLSAKHFPLPQLINTTDGQSFSHLPSAASAQSPASAPSENIYELFEFIPAAHYPQTLEATENAGYTLALYHQSLLDFTPAWEPGPSSYHRARALAQNFTRIAAAGQVPTSLLDSLQTLVTTAAEAVDASGYSTWPKRIIHADWHPGNMLFREDRVVAVLDFDSARRLPIAIDLANGALQFSMIDGDENPAKWPDQTDESRYRKFLHGYRQLAAFSSAESAVLPWLMIEALIAEAVYPIAATGTFGRISGDIFLHMVARKANWLALHAHHLIQLAESA